jgi:hypothetical protein
MTWKRAAVFEALMKHLQTHQSVLATGIRIEGLEPVEIRIMLAGFQAELQGKLRRNQVKEELAYIAELTRANETLPAPH